ncbi:hypothetical protein MWU54_13640 [Marivita sp. S6314]|uniref:hypothetical protein n=1 Tax=Marivita sp. S6314 TaxID=2926406 RepID=UPI001FF48AC9|nr:hypothetical protein [Marivita sp. S6314]MCK0151078.1 hypothetical protein [Marivita sp. S6314]
MKDLDIPNWTDIAEYGSTDRWSLKRWRWEFLRRREDLRQEFDLNAPSEYEGRLFEAEQEPNRYPYGVLKPSQPGFYILSTSITADSWEPLPNPRISDQPEAVLTMPPVGVTVLAHGEIVTDNPKEAVLKFDLRKPVRNQIAEAKKYLMEQQQAQIGGKVQFRKLLGKWLTYLRILDARTCGASWEKIAEVLSHEDQVDRTWVNKAHAAAVRLTMEFKI